VSGAPSLAVSSWSLHETLGPMYPELAPGAGPRAAQRPFGDGRCELLGLPALVRDELGVARLELCHFHLPSSEPGYLDELVARLGDAGVALTTLLVDAGDVTHPDPDERRAQRAHLRGWIDVAARLGARRVRITTGAVDPDAPDAVAQSADGLAELLEHADERGLALLTENWHDPLSLRPELLLALLDRFGGRLGLCVDFANWLPGMKEATMRALLPRAATIHAKAQYDADGALDAPEFQTWLRLAHASGFAGDFVLIYADGGDEPDALLRVKEQVLLAAGDAL